MLCISTVCVCVCVRALNNFQVRHWPRPFAIFRLYFHHLPCLPLCLSPAPLPSASRVASNVTNPVICWIWQFNSTPRWAFAPNRCPTQFEPNSNPNARLPCTLSPLSHILPLPHSFTPSLCPPCPLMSRSVLCLFQSVMCAFALFLLILLPILLAAAAASVDLEIKQVFRIQLDIQFSGTLWS